MSNIPPLEIALKLEELNSWRNRRVTMYGTVTEQLNLLYDDINAGLFGEQAKSGMWFQHIQNIKKGVIKPDVQKITAELDALMLAQPFN